MPQLEHEQAIKQYWEEVKTQYPDVDFEQFKLVCKSPFLAVRQWMKDPKLPIIMLKYLGKIRVFPSKIKAQLRFLELRKEKNMVDKDTYKKEKEFYNQYLKDLESEEEEDFELIDDEE